MRKATEKEKLEADRIFHVFLGSVGALWMYYLLPSHTIWLPICMSGLTLAAAGYWYKIHTAGVAEK